MPRHGARARNVPPPSPDSHGRVPAPDLSPDSGPAHSPHGAPFRQFLAGLLKWIGLSEGRVALYTGPAALAKFSRAFTHKSCDPVANYERYEFVGDTVVNGAVAAYLATTKFPRLQSVKWLTRLKHTLISKKQLARLAYARGFLPHIRWGAPEAALFETEAQRAAAAEAHGEADPLAAASKEFLSLLEDVFEAFAGALQDVADTAEPGKPQVGLLVAHRMVETFLGTLDISLDYDELFDAKTRYKQLCDKHGWQFRAARAGQRGAHDATMVYDTGPHGTRVEVYGFPRGNRARHPANRARLCVAHGRDRDDAQQLAARQALEVLERDYGICEDKPDPYEL